MNAHLIYIPWTGVGVHGGFRGNAWYKHRIEVFKKYTLKSLANQSNKDFLIWCSFRPEEEKNPLTETIAEALKEANLKFIFTFDGLMYHDDKFTNYTVKTALRNLLQMVWDCWWYKEWKSPFTLWRYTWENKNKTLLKRLGNSLQKLKELIGSDYEWIYLTRIDSDDMFHREAIACIQAKSPEHKKALVFDKGYIYNVQTGQLGEWNPPTNPPFHTIIFPAHNFFDPQEHKAYYGAFKSHEDITKVFNCTKLDINKYCVSFHGKHISTAWESPILKKIYHKAKYGKTDPFKTEIEGYCYTTSGQNISTRWQSRARKQKNPMIGEEIDNKAQLLAEFGL